MDVDAAEPGRVQDLSGQDQPIGGDHGEVEIEGRELRLLLGSAQAARLRVILPTDRRQLRPFMWPLLQRLGVETTNSYPYPVRPRSAGAADAAAARLRARRLLVIDWEAGVASDTRNDTHHLPPRHALRTLRARLAAPGAHLAWAAPRRRSSPVCLNPCCR